MHRTDLSRLPVIKKIAPTRPGAVRLAERYGATLVCVRHRLDPVRNVRVTTVEIVVDQSPIRSRDAEIVSVRIGFGQRQLRASALEAGAQWDAERKLWRMERRTAKALGLNPEIDQNG